MSNCAVSGVGFNDARTRVLELGGTKRRQRSVRSARPETRNPKRVQTVLAHARRSTACEAEGVDDSRGKQSRRSALITCITTTSVWAISLANPSIASANNDAVLAALKRKDTSDSMDGGQVQTRLNLALDELRRAQTLASVGEYTEARSLLRKGALEQVRLDLRKVGQYLRVQRPTFDQFEGLAVTGGLDAFDNSMRAMQQGVAEVTARDVNLNAKSTVSALEEVCYVLGKDTTYEAMKERLEGGVEKKKEENIRRDFLDEERAILSDARIGAE